jgi:hypothetical protein
MGRVGTCSHGVLRDTLDRLGLLYALASFSIWRDLLALKEGSIPTGVFSSSYRAGGL